MMRANRVLFGLARGPRLLMHLLVWPTCRSLRRDPQRALERLLASVPAADRAALAKPGCMRLLAASTAESLRQGTGPFVQEAALYVRPWGFRLEDVQTRIDLHQGEVDVNVPVGMARQQEARLPHCRAQYYPAEGHYSLVLNHIEEILGALLAS